VFCDLRGVTGFAERAEPEEVMALLRDYHAAMGRSSPRSRYARPLRRRRHHGVLQRSPPDARPGEAGDRHGGRDARSGARPAADVAAATATGFGVGISQGYATLGQIGFGERMDYTRLARSPIWRRGSAPRPRTGRSWSAAT